MGNCFGCVSEEVSGEFQTEYGTLVESENLSIHNEIDKKLSKVQQAKGLVSCIHRDYRELLSKQLSSQLMGLFKRPPSTLTLPELFLIMENVFTVSMELSFLQNVLEISKTKLEKLEPRLKTGKCKQHVFDRFLSSVETLEVYLLEKTLE